MAPIVSFACRLRRYQRKSFPLPLHLPVMTVLVLAGFGQAGAFPGWPAAAAVTAILAGAFFQMHVGHDLCRTPVDGSLSRGELVAAGLVAAVLQIALAAAVVPTVFPVLGAVYVWVVVSALGIGASQWQRLLAVPLIATIPVAAATAIWPSPGPVLAFLVACFGNAVVVDLGRMIGQRPPPRQTVAHWAVALAGTAVAAMLALQGQGPAPVVLAAFAFAAVTSGIFGLCRGRPHGVEAVSGLWMLGSLAALAWPLMA